MLEQSLAFEDAIIAGHRLGEFLNVVRGSPLRSLCARANRMTAALDASDAPVVKTQIMYAAEVLTSVFAQRFLFA